MRFEIEGLQVYFPYQHIYPEQYEYMVELKRCLDHQGHCLLEMPTGTGKTISLLSLITSYQLVHPEIGKLIYCTRTVPEMEKVLSELKALVDYRNKNHFPNNPPKILAVGLSSRKNMCVHPQVADEGSRESVDSRCKELTASWVREKALQNQEVALCDFFENHERAGSEALLPPGVYTLHDLREFGREKGWCPYFLSRHMMSFSNVVIYNYQYMIDPKVTQLVSSQLERECVVVFDEAHNIDNVCIEALSVNIRQQILDYASRNLINLNSAVDKQKHQNAQKLQDEYNRLLEGLSSQVSLPQSNVHGGEDLRSNPALPQDILNESVPGNIRRAEHFLGFMKRFIAYLQKRINTQKITQENPTSFVEQMQQEVMLDPKGLRFCYDRLVSLMKTLEISNTDVFLPIQLVADFATLVGTYAKGFAIIIEPFDSRMPSVPDPVLQLTCLDASLAMKPIFERFQSVVITSGTLSPLDFYPKILNFDPISIKSLNMTLTRACLCPVVVTRGEGQVPITTRFEDRNSPDVLKAYGTLMIELTKVVPDGIIAFFVSYLYMDQVVRQWYNMGVMKDISRNKLIFIETQDVVETTLALDNYRRACDCGRGAVFLSVARGKVAEGIDFDRHYGRCVVMMGVPYQYTLSRILRARLSYLEETFQIKENDYLTFDALRQSAQCVGRVLRSKADYGIMIFADKRYQRYDKRSKLPQWITCQMLDANLNLSTEMLMHVSRDFMRKMGQPYDMALTKGQLLTADDIYHLQHNRPMEIDQEINNTQTQSIEVP